MVRAELPKAVPSILQDIEPQLNLVPGSNVSNHPYNITSTKNLSELGKQVEEVNL